jgi:NAD(P)-dependent dehydrogenase (short-subunit alcohol dehydrogenase family)
MKKVWFITGASSGFGEALASAAIQEGHQVAATFRNAAAAQAFGERGSAALGVVMDVRDEQSIAAGIKKAAAHFGRLDVIVNNAGYGTIGAVEEFTMEEIRQQMETNFFGAVAVTKEALPYLRQQGSGHIIQISSAAGFKATGGFGVYNASKFALEGFSEALAQEVAPFGIKVVIVQPGPFRTKFAAGSVKLAALRMDEYKRTPVAQMYHYISRIDGRQEGDPAKAALAILNYVDTDNAALRLPLGKHALDAIKAKLVAVQADIDSNREIALSTLVDAPL